MPAPVAALAAIGAKAKAALAVLRRLRRLKRLAALARSNDNKKTSRSRKALIAAAALVAVLLAPLLVAGGCAAVVVAFVSSALPGSSTPSPVAHQAIPGHVLAAYRSATAQHCRSGEMSWTVLAGVGAVESGHGTLSGGYVDPIDMTIKPDPILGPVLDGSLAGTRVIPIGPYAGRYGLPEDARYQQALGPMQFLAPTWEATAASIGLHGASPHNLSHAAHAAAAKLCSAIRRHRDDKDREQALRAAIFEYNNSEEYIDAVLAKAAAYDATVPLSALTDIAAPAHWTDFSQSVHLSDVDQYALIALELIEPALSDALQSASSPQAPLDVELVALNEARIVGHSGAVVHPDSDITASVVSAAATALAPVDGAYICGPGSQDPPLVVAALPEPHPSAGAACLDEIRLVVPSSVEGF